MLSKKTKYGLKALSYLARQSHQDPIGINEIATAEGISRKFLESIMLTLRKNGFVGSRKGKNGGYYLMKSPREVTMASVFRVLEGPIALVPCVSLNFYEKCDDCPNEKTCTVHDLMLQLRDNMLYILEQKTLADFCSPN